jgi:hypothetical protein
MFWRGSYVPFLTSVRVAKVSAILPSSRQYLQLCTVSHRHHFFIYVCWKNIRGYYIHSEIERVHVVVKLWVINFI